MRGRSSGKTGPPATRASPGKAGGLKLMTHTNVKRVVALEGLACRFERSTA